MTEIKIPEKRYLELIEKEMSVYTLSRKLRNIVISESATGTDGSADQIRPRTIEFMKKYNIEDKDLY